MALLIGFGAAAVNPYLALDSIDDMISEGLLEGVSPRQARRNYIKAACKGVLKVMSKMGISTVASYTGAQVFEAIGLDGAADRRVLHRDRLADRRRRARGAGGRGGDAPPRRPTSRARPSGPTASSRWAASTSGAARASSTSSTRRRCSSSSTPRGPSATTSSRSTRARGRRPVREAGDAARAAAAEAGAGRTDPARGGGAGLGHHGPLLHRRHVLRLHLGRGPRDPRHRHEPHRRAVQHRRGRGGRRPLHARRQRRPAAQRHQAGGLGPLRRHERVPGQRRRPADQDLPGGQAGRGRPAGRASRSSPGSPGPGARRRAWG